MPKHPIMLVALLLFASSGVPGSGTASPSEEMPTQLGHHVVTHLIPNDFNSNHPEAALAAVDKDGVLVMYAYLHFGFLYVSDGRDDAGQPVEREVGRFWIAGASRIDLTFEGETYFLQVDQRHEVRARTLTAATEAGLLDPPSTVMPWTVSDARMHRTRADAGDGSMETTFSKPLDASSPWKPHATAGRVEIHHAGVGYQSIGYASIFQPIQAEALGGRPEGVTYLAADLAGVGATYGVEASFKISTLFPPLGVAVLAGISGDADAPTARWAVEIDIPPLTDVTDLWGPTDRALYLKREDSSRTHLASWHDSQWRSIQVLVDESAGSLQIRLNDQDLGTFTNIPARSATAIAVGDVDARTPDVSDTWFHVDDLAIFPIVTQGAQP